MKWVKELIPYIIIIVIVVLIRSFIITPVKVNGASMNPTLQNNDVLLLQKLNRNFKRFDIVVFNYNGEKLIKRVVGLPGEYVEYKNNQLYINNKLVKETFHKAITGYFDLKSLNYDVIPKGYYFVMGDNRTNSVDSRMIGLIKAEDILGKTSFVVYPIQNFGIID